MSAMFDIKAAQADATPHVPYEGQRRRLMLMERLTAAWHGLSIELAREMVAREVRLTPTQIVNIRKRKKKNLYGEIRDRIDARFLALAGHVVRDLTLEMAALDAAADGPDPRALAQAMASRDALNALIAETREAAGRRQALRRQAAAEGGDAPMGDRDGEAGS